MTNTIGVGSRRSPERRPASLPDLRAGEVTLPVRRRGRPRPFPDVGACPGRTLLRLADRVVLATERRTRSAL